MKLTAILAAGLTFACTFAQAQQKTDTAKTLTKVTVTGHRPLVEHLIDRTVINADALPGKEGSTLMDLLEKSPGVTVEQNTIQLQGRDGVTIYIDDKPTYLSGDALANYLRSLPASAVDRIELMTNPPAKYDAAGTGGVINIRLKRVREKGLNGNLTLNYIQGVYARTNNSLNLNIRQNKLNVAATFGYTLINNFTDINLSRDFDPAVISDIAPVFTQRSNLTYHAQNYSGRITADYYLTDKTTVGMVLSGLFTHSGNPTANTSILSSQDGQVDSTIIANNTNNRQFHNGAFNLNYRHDYDKKGSQLSLDLDYIIYHTRIAQSFANNSYYPDGTLYEQTLQTGSLPSHIDIYSAKTDYTRVLSSGLRLSAGAKTSYTATDNIADYFDIESGTAAPDYNFTNHFLYSENINAVYINGAKDYNRLSLQAGLRFENTIAYGHQLGNPEKPDSSFNRGYNSLFPTFYAKYKLDSATSQAIGFSVGRRIDRPNYASLNPFVSPLDKFTYNTGNPFLLPSYSVNCQLYYSYKHITATLYYIYIKDRVDGLIQIINGYYYSQPGNLGNSYDRGIELNADLDPAKWFNIHLYARFRILHTVTNFYTGPLNTTGQQLTLRPTLTFKPGHSWTLQAWGGYQSRFVNEQFTDLPRGSLNFDFEKKLTAAATVELDLYDVLRTQNNSWYIGYLEGTTASYHSVNDTRNIVLSFNYRFGKTIKDQRHHAANGAQSEMNRVGN
jgi:Outer membrane protein beta-barrel family/TonB-dependent Receptor Plug Domain